MNFYDQTTICRRLSPSSIELATGKRKIYHVYSISCMLFTLLTTLVIVLNGADCLTSISGQTSSSVDKLVSLKLSAGTQSSYKYPDLKREVEEPTIFIKENTPKGTKLATIPTKDYGSRAAGISFALLPGPDSEAFEVRSDGHRADLISKIDFDYESPKTSYNVFVRAGGPFLWLDIVLEIRITDENDNEPQLQDFTIVFNNYKNNFPIGPIGRVPAFDADVNDQLIYRIISGNNAEVLFVNETTGEIQLSPWLNSNVPSKHFIEVVVSDGPNEVKATVTLIVNLVTEAMLQNSVVLRLDGIGRQDFLSRKFDLFTNEIQRVLGMSGMPDRNNIVIFNVDETIQESSAQDLYPYRPYQNSPIVNTTISVDVSFSVRAGVRDLDSYLTSQFIEERIYLNRAHLSQSLDVYVAPFQDNLCIEEPCQAYQACQAVHKFDEATKLFLSTKNMIFRPIKTKQNFMCTCPPTFTGTNFKSECNLQIAQCFSNPCLNGGICHQHESGYTCECPSGFLGPKCDVNYSNSTCQSIAMATSSGLGLHQYPDDSKLCHGKRCPPGTRLTAGSSSVVGQTGAISTQTGVSSSCQGCPKEMCPMRARSFTRNSYITLPSLRRRHQFQLSLKFATIQTDALLMYNGRYNNRHDFIALEIIDSGLRFSYSLGSSAIHTVSLLGVSVSTGEWHKINIDYTDRNVTLILDDCDPALDEALARISALSGGRRCSNSTSNDGDFFAGNGSGHYRALDLNSPMQIGGLPVTPAEFKSVQTSFTGCLSDLYIDHQLIDLATPIQQVGTQPGCPEKRPLCQPESCRGQPCQESWGAPKCNCGENYLGKSCEILMSYEKVRRFSGNSYITFSPIESTVGSLWQVSLHFRTIQPSGLLLRISLDTELIVMLELANSGLRLSYRSQNLTLSKIELDDGEWHYAEFTWTAEQLQMQVDFNPNLAISSSEFGSVVGSVIKQVTVGASPTKLNQGSSSPSGLLTASSSLVGSPSPPTTDLQSDSPSDGVSGDIPVSPSSIGTNLVPNPLSNSVSLAGEPDYSSLYGPYQGMIVPNSTLGTVGSVSPHSFVGCIYGLNVSADGNEIWISGSGEERNLERGCQVADVCEQPAACPPNSRCIRKGMNQRRCICQPGFVGDRCLPVCDINPCHGENSRCYPILATNQSSTSSSSTIDDALFASGSTGSYTNSSLVLWSSEAYRCECEPNRSGKNCEHQLSSECPPNWWAKAVVVPASSQNSSQVYSSQAPALGSSSLFCGPCECEDSRGFDGNCDKQTGHCICKPNHYQPPGANYCVACDCYGIGSLKVACNQTSGQCSCRPGVVGRRCDSCASGFAEVTLRGCDVIYDGCPKTFSDGIWWEKTPLGHVATDKCPQSTSRGTATRFCHKTEGWMKANLFDCISNTFDDLYHQFKFLEANKTSINREQALGIAYNLRQALNETITNPSMQLYGSDMLISFRLLHHLIQYEARQGLNLTHRKEKLYISYIVESISYLLEPAYAENWPTISKESQIGGAEHLLRLLDTYARALIQAQQDTATQPFEVTTNQLTFGLDTVSAEQLVEPARSLGSLGTAIQLATGASAPYASDPFEPSNPSSTQHGSTLGSPMRSIYQPDGISIYLENSLQADGSPAVVIPKYDNYAPEQNWNSAESTKVIISLKTLRIRNPSELLSSSSPTSYFGAAKSRAKRATPGLAVSSVDSLLIPELRPTRHNQMGSGQVAIVAYSIWKSLGPLLPNAYDNTVLNRDSTVAAPSAPVVWLTIRPANNSTTLGALSSSPSFGEPFLSRNIQPKINYVLKMSEPIGKSTPRCAIWDFNSGSVLPTSSSNLNQANNQQRDQGNPSYGLKPTGRFSTKGCELKAIHQNHKHKYKFDYVNCSCDHLGAVTLLIDSATNRFDYMSMNGEVTFGRDIGLVVGLSLSLAILAATMFVLTCVRGHSIKSNSNSINKNLLLILIALEILLIYGHLSRRATLIGTTGGQNEYQCKLIAIFLQYFSITLFHWLLVNAIHFYRMLTELRDINHGPMKFYQVLGYAIPAFFVSVAVGLRMEQFGNHPFCWLSVHEPIIWSMFGPIAIVSLVIMLIFALAFCKSFPAAKKFHQQEGEQHYPGPTGTHSASQAALELIKSHLFINTVKTPIIGIYWLMAVYSVNEVGPLENALPLLFPISAVIKSIILFGLLCIVDSHIRYNLYVSWLRLLGRKLPSGYLDDPAIIYSSSNGNQLWPSHHQVYQQVAMVAGTDQTGLLNKHYHRVTSGQHLNPQTPGFASSCTDIFRPEVLNGAYSAASTTSRSSGSSEDLSGSSGASAHPYHRTNGAGGHHGLASSPSRRHRRHRKKSSSHHKHHHHRHHHKHHSHNHHHRSHSHQHHHHHHQNGQELQLDDDRRQYESAKYGEAGQRRRHHSSRRRNEDQLDRHHSNGQHIRRKQPRSESSVHEDLASSHSSDQDETGSVTNREQRQPKELSSQQTKMPNTTTPITAGGDQNQTLPMQLSRSEVDSPEANSKSVESVREV